MEALDGQVATATGTSDCCSITSGYRFTLSNHPNASLNKQYTIVTATHEAEQNPSYTSNESANDPYTNSFTCILHGSGSPGFRPAAKTPKPSVHGSQTAVVVGPSGEEIYTDKYGRVKVQFYWDREGKVNEVSSCWVRVAQSWAGNKWGAMFIPRIGMEVVVHFLEGDPDQPIVTGCVYNPQTMPPYTLPDEKTKSTIKTDSSKGGGGFNELRFEDKKGSEQIFIHAEKNQDIRVKNDCMELIQHDRHLIVENDQYEKVKKDKHLQVTGDHNEKITGTMSLDVGSDQQNKVGQNYAVESGMGVHIKAGMTTVIEAGTALTLKVGGSSININTGGIQIIGSPMLMLNSGGAATPGAGCSPEAPKDAKEADKADPGQRVQLPPANAPLAPVRIGPLAALLKSAAQSGQPFCDT
jgi:type VI secretion system secreted protein VgrG